MPALIEVKDENFTARVLDIAHHGVMLETLTTLELRTSLTLRCGHVEAKALVIWANGGRYGIKFSTPLQDRDIDQQVARTKALGSRRTRRVSGPPEALSAITW